jgi:hypothetical protein
VDRSDDLRTVRQKPTDEIRADESCGACHQYATHRSIQPMAAMLPGAIVRGRRPADVLSRRRAIVRLARSGSGEIFNQ